MEPQRGSGSVDLTAWRIMSGPLRLTRTAWCSFVDRFGGVSRAPYDELNVGDHVGDEPGAVDENRRRLAADLGVGRDRLVFLRQVHGRDVAVFTEASAGHRTTAGTTRGVPQADAAVTTTSGLALVVVVADCAPVVLAADEPAVVAVAHAGRRGLVGGVVSATIQAMSGLGCDPRRLVARIGPAICGACYEVPPHLQAEVAASVPEALATTGSGSPALDIRAGLVAQLRHCGLTSIEVDPRCTQESPELFSHRRDGRTGRSAAVTWLDP